MAGKPNSNLVELPPDFPIIGGGIAPELSIVAGGTTLKIPTYLVLKVEIFLTPLKTHFLDVSRGVSGKLCLKVQKIDFYSIFKPQFFENLLKFSKMAPPKILLPPILDYGGRVAQLASGGLALPNVG